MTKSMRLSNDLLQEEYCKMIQVINGNKISMQRTAEENLLRIQMQISEFDKRVLVAESFRQDLQE